MYYTCCQGELHCARLPLCAHQYGRRLAAHDHADCALCVQSRVQVHYIMDEMLLNGCIVDTNKVNILEPVQLLDQVSM
jgi:AP-4 complex subunit sigma-1